MALDHGRSKKFVKQDIYKNYLFGNPTPLTESSVPTPLPLLKYSLKEWKACLADFPSFPSASGRRDDEENKKWEEEDLEFALDAAKDSLIEQANRAHEEVVMPMSNLIHWQFIVGLILGSQIRVARRTMVFSLADSDPSCYPCPQ